MYRYIAVLFLAAAVLPVQAGEAINKTVDADPDGEVVIEVTRGKVKVTGWNQNAVSVEGTRDDRSEAFRVERKGKVITIEDEIEHGRGGKGTDITVKIPRTGSLKTSVVSTDLDLSGIAGSVRVETVSGDVRADKLGSEVRIETVSGAVQGTLESARLRVESVSGVVEVRNAGSLARGRLSSVSGKVTLETAVAPDGDLELESISGDVFLTLRGEINARIRAETGPGGDITNHLNDAEPERQRYVGAESLELRLGNGGADINLSVVTGGIHLQK